MMNPRLLDACSGPFSDEFLKAGHFQSWSFGLCRPTFQSNPSPSAGRFAPPSPVSSKELKGNNVPSGITVLTIPVRTEGAHTSALKSQSSAWMVVAIKWRFLEAKNHQHRGKIQNLQLCSYTGERYPPLKTT